MRDTTADGFMNPNATAVKYQGNDERGAMRVLLQVLISRGVVMMNGKDDLAEGNGD
jgi:hypothetical protein